VAAAAHPQLPQSGLLELSLSISVFVAWRGGSIMSSDNVWQLDTRGRQVGPQRSEITDLESRLDWSERFVSQHEQDIKQTRYEVANTTAHLEKRIAYLEKLTKRSERLITFLSDIMIALIAFLFAGLVAAYLEVNVFWKGGGALIAFVAILLAGHFVFKRLQASPLIARPRNKTDAHQKPPFRTRLLSLFRRSDW
jgi:hypothetical protein